MVSRLLYCWFLIGCCAIAHAVNYGGHMLKEVLNLKLRIDVKIGRRADAKRNHTVVFARAQRGVDELTALLTDVSDPRSRFYGKHRTKEEVALLTANPEASAAITSFLAEYGLVPTHVSKYGDFIKVDAPIATWEKLFATEFYEFTHKDRKLPPFVRSLNYSLPSSLHRHVHAVFNTAQLPALSNHAPTAMLEKASMDFKGYTTPPLLNDVYNIGSNAGNDLTTQAFYGSLLQSMSPSDLTQFQNMFGLPLQSIVAATGGHVEDDACNPIQNCMEANLDVQYIMAIAQNVPTIYNYWTGQDIWLDWITGIADMDDPPAVISISYASYEFSMAAGYLEAFNTEAIKLGVMGTTLLAASGDDGVAGFVAREMGPSFCDYMPMFPASSPYVTAVGGTMGPEDRQPEVACQSNKGGMITTGGGFSYAFPAPAWQTDAVSGYLVGFLQGEGAARVPKYGFPRNMRGYPDVSLLANKFVIAASGQFYEVSGTSGSCPVMAGMVSLVNAARRAEGKPTLGFLNPALYALHSAFTHDITSGENNCLAKGAPCCEVGFTAAEGWDPVTGLGSIDFEKFKQVMLELTDQAPTAAAKPPWDDEAREYPPEEPISTDLLSSAPDEEAQMHSLIGIIACVALILAALLGCKGRNAPSAEGYTAVA